MAPFRKNDEGQDQRYRTIFESDMVGILATKMDGTIMDANDYFLKMVGYTRAELKRGEVNWRKLTPPEFAEKSKIAGEEVLNKRTIKAFEKEYFHKDGHRVPVIVGLTMFNDSTIIAIVLDLSQRKKTEKELAEAKLRLEERVTLRTQELQRSEAFLEAVYENIPNMVFVKDAKDLRFVRFNRAGEELIGVPRSAMIGKNDYDFFPKDQADFFTSKDRHVLSEARVVDIPEEPIQTSHGVRYLHTKKIPIFDAKGKPQYLLGVSEDITERKIAEQQRLALLQEQIAREEAELRARQMSFLSDISLIFSETFEIEKILNSFCQKVATGMADICIVDLLNEEGVEIAITEVSTRDEAEEAIVKDWKSRHHLRWESSEGPAEVLKSGRSVLHSHLEAQNYLQKAFGSEASLERPIQIESLMMTPIKVRQEKPVGLVTFLNKSGSRHFNDIDLAIAEEISRRLALAIENSRLYYKAQEASRAKSAFLANVSHEIRTPLGAMLGFAEILREDDSLSSDQRESIQIVLRNGQQLLRIVDEILDISKVESERIQIEHISFSLRQLLDDVVHLLAGRADEKGISLNVHYDSLPEFVRTDPTRLRQILINVIGNAIKFTDAGEVELFVTKKKSLLEFRVTDTGIGISREQRMHLFQPFMQADSSTTRRFGGTGLGLFLSRKLARLLGGDVILDTSVSGQGSSFIITIAYTETPKDETRLTNQKDLKMDGYSNIKSILVVDDAVDNRDLFRHYLRKMGVPTDRIDVAQNGAEAVRMALQKEYSLILMDIQMPEMDGFQALHALKDKNYKGLIVALTAHAMKGDEEKCLAEGFDGYLQKPLSKEALQEVLTKTNTRPQ